MLKHGIRFTNDKNMATGAPEKSSIWTIGLTVVK